MKKIKIKLFFAWYDLWIGVFVDRKKRNLYIFPIPMFGILIHFHKWTLKTSDFGSMYHPNTMWECNSCKNKEHNWKE